MQTNLATALEELRRLEAAALERYRALAPTVSGPAERRLAESVIERKGAHVAKLSTLPGAPGADGLELPDGWPFKAAGLMPADDAARALLSLILNEESALSRSYAALAAAAVTAAPEASFALRALADSSGKFALWAEEHLELLGLG
ncbi:MAG TPA: hypothetical protein PKW82_02795 [Spirochaetales bacterium]|nr:hypothetical protein [Spirochaetales bacterium]